jgi:ATP-dependent RNA helicase DeaD
MPKPIVALAKRYQKDALRISTVGENRGHGDIAYQAVTVAPNDIENAVVNLLRLHEAESALAFCATRENVRRLHSSLTERGFSAVALSGEHSQNERNQALQALRDGRARVLVATDVAARGIDLPNLTLVIHVELPRDAETLQHRSGRTGRAGKKGTAILLVPYPRRKRVDAVLRGARIEAEWMKPPTPEDIRKSDHDRLLAALLEPVEMDEDDRELAQRLLEQKTPEEIAAALVRVHRDRMPAPEEMVDGNSSDGGQAERPQGPRQGFEDTIWFRMNIGRHHNADPRWLLPLLCRRGHITRNDIGAIRIAANETMFEIPRAAATRFAQSVKRTSTDDDGEGSVRIEAVEGKPRDAARQNRREGPPPSGPRSGGYPDGPPASGPRAGPGPGGPRAGAGPGGPRAGAGTGGTRHKAMPTPWKAKGRPKG